jgi:hypothetical protein
MSILLKANMLLSVKIGGRVSYTYITNIIIDRTGVTHIMWVDGDTMEPDNHNVDRFLENHYGVSDDGEIHVEAEDIDFMQFSLIAV